MKKTNLYLLKVLKTLERKVNNQESIAKKSADGLYKIEAAIERKANEKTLSIGFQRFVGWASILLAILAAFLSWKSIKMTYENRKIATSIDSMRLLILKQDTQINNQDSQILLLSGLATESKIQSGKLSSVIEKNTQVLDVLSRQLKINQQVLDVANKTANERIQSDYYTLRRVVEKMPIICNAQNQIENLYEPKRNIIIRRQLLNIDTILSINLNNSYLLNDTVFRRKWNQVRFMGKKLYHEIEYHNTYFTDKPSNLQRSGFVKLIKSFSDFCGEYNSLKVFFGLSTMDPDSWKINL